MLKWQLNIKLNLKLQPNLGLNLGLNIKLNIKLQLNLGLNLGLYNHFKGYKRTFNSNLYNDINIVSFGRVAMLECFKRCTNKIFRLNICKNKLILKIIIIKIILLIRNNVNDIKYQKPQKLKMLQDSQLKSILFQTSQSY